jgi:hypothetical protein
MAPGGAELGPLGMSDCRADEDVGTGPGALWAPDEHPVIAKTPAATTTALHCRDRSPHQRTV